MAAGRFFLDTSALFAGLWAAQGGGARLLLRLGEARQVRLLVSGQVLAELERALRSKAPEVVPQVAVILDLAGVTVVPDGSKAAWRKAMGWLSHPADARVLAAALESSPDFFVTLDRQPFLNNALLRREAPFSIGTPGDALAWWRAR